MSKSLAIQNAARNAYERLALPYTQINETVEQADKHGVKQQIPVMGANNMPKKKFVINGWHVNPASVTCPSILIQEKPLDGTTNILNFDFSQTAPQPSPTLNNILLGINDVAVMYGIQVLFGVGANGVSRQYFTHGLVAGDDALYQGSNMSIQFEQAQAIKNIDMNDFRYVDGTDYKPEEVVKLMQPLRLLTGRLGTFLVQINLQSLAGLAFSPNAFVSVRLHIALGQAKGTT